MAQIPPPPPAPGRTGPPPRPDSLPRGVPGQPGPAGGGGGGGGGPPLPFMIPIRNSTRFSSVNSRIPLTEDECRKKLTSLKAFTIRKAVPYESRSGKSTWAQAQITEEAWPEEEIAKEVKRLNGKGLSVTEKKQKLAPNQQAQVNIALDDQINADKDQNFEWSLVQLDSRIKKLRSGLAETTTLTVYLKRTPSPNVIPGMLYEAIQKGKVERLQPKIPPKPADLPGTGVIKLPNDKGGGPGKGGGGGGGKGPVKKQKGKKSRGNSSSSSYSDYDSDSYSDDSYSSSDNTSHTSDSFRRKRGDSGRRRSFSRHREHQLRIGNGPSRSPPFGGFSGLPYNGGPQPIFIPPEVPSVPAVDVEAIYHAGQLDERYRHDHSIRPLPEARAIVTYGRGDIYEPRPLGPRIVEARDVRYVDDLRYADDLRYTDDLRNIEDDILRRRERGRDDYIDSRRRSEPRIVFSNPFRERRRSRYSSSIDSYDNMLY